METTEDYPASLVRLALQFAAVEHLTKPDRARTLTGQFVNLAVKNGTYPHFDIRSRFGCLPMALTVTMAVPEH